MLEPSRSSRDSPKQYRGAFDNNGKRRQRYPLRRIASHVAIMYVSENVLGERNCKEICHVLPLCCVSSRWAPAEPSQALVEEK